MKNKTELLINIFNVVAILIEAIVVLIISLFNKGWVFLYRELCVSLAVLGIIDFVFLLIKEIKILSYDSKKFTPFMHVAHTFLGVLLYYLALYLDFGKWNIMLWIFLILALILPIIIFTILNYFYVKKNKDKKPKFIVNK